MKYKFEQFENVINCESWFLRNINTENNSSEIILIDTEGQQYSHTFLFTVFYDSIEDIKTHCTNELKAFEVSI